MLSLILWLKSGFGDDFGQYDTKTVILRCFLAKHLLEIALPLLIIATLEIPGDHKTNNKSHQFF